MSVCGNIFLQWLKLFIWFACGLQGSGLPAGKFGLLGLAEGLAFLALFAGVIVLVLQLTNFGYIPNAIPMEGGMCQ